jgi:putative ATP-binding cassette transporter
VRLILGQIWRLLRFAASGPGRGISLLLLALVIIKSLVAIQVTLLLIAWNANFYNALQRIDAAAAIHQVGVFALLIGASAALFLVGTYLKQTLNIRWRRRLTETVLDRWLSHKAYWMLDPSLGGAGIDNPDQRIADDCRMFIDTMLNKVLEFFISLIGLVSYVTVLWQLSTFPLSFNIFGFDVEIARYMVWAAPLYVAISTGLTHLLGRQLPDLYAEQQKREADFRFGLMRMREASAAVALSDGEAAERRVLSDRFSAITDIWHRVIRRELILGCFSRPYFSTVLRIPMFLALPAFLAGRVTLGGLMQISSAFQNVVTTMSWFIFNYRAIADLAATVRRLNRFLEAVDGVTSQDMGVRRAASTDNTEQIRQLTLRTPTGQTLLTIPELVLKPGEAVWLQGASGLGKSTLIKALAGLWPHGDGEIALPPGRILFMPQQVYSPLGPLNAAATYPAAPDALPPAEIDELLEKVGLGQRGRADVEGTKGLSGGEQQRLALVRILVAQPDWVFLDEATSALDLESEATLMALMHRLLPNTTFVLIAHREPRGLPGLRSVSLTGCALQAA